MTEAERLVTEAEASGYRLVLVGPEVIVRGEGPKPSALIERLCRHRKEVIALLRRQPQCCARCGATDVRSIASYWTDWREALCPECVQQLAAWFDRTGWPPAPWEDEAPGRSEVS